MSNIITARDLAMVTSDIQYAQRQGARQLASNLIEIGRLLVEAKTMVEPKDWEKYIWDHFGYSTSTADNWMKLYREYGDDQESLFASFQESQAFGRMSYTKLLALTAIPAEERAEFVEKNDVENMSTRQLQQAIKERDEAIKAKEEAEHRAEEAEQKALESAASADVDAEKAKQQAEELKSRAETAEQAEARARKSESNALGLVEKYKKQLEQAKQKEESLKEDLKKAQENPDIPDAIMEQMRKEVEADAAKQATEKLQKQLAAAETAAQEAAKAREAAEAQAREAEAKLAAMKKDAKLADPDIAKFLALCEQLQEDYNRVKGLYNRTKLSDETKAASMQKATLALLEDLRKGMA